MKNWPWYLWALFIGLISLIAFIFSYLFYLYSTISFLLIYVGVIGLIVGGVWLQGKYFGPTYHLHIHHYFLGLSMCLIVCYQNVFFTLVHSIFNGIMIEGGCRWGYSPLWEQNDACTALRSKNDLEHIAQSQARY